MSNRIISHLASALIGAAITASAFVTVTRPSTKAPLYNPAALLHNYGDCLQRDRAMLVRLYRPHDDPYKRAFQVLAFQADCAMIHSIPTYTPADLYSLANVAVCCPLRNAPPNYGASPLVHPGLMRRNR